MVVVVVGQEGSERERGGKRREYIGSNNVKTTALKQIFGKRKRNVIKSRCERKICFLLLIRLDSVGRVSLLSSLLRCSYNKIILC